MKRHGNIYYKIYDIENLRLAHQKAKKDKSFYSEVKMIDTDPDHYLYQIQSMLKEKTYKVTDSDYTMFEKVDKGKIRKIFKLDYFPHRIIQHALMNLIDEILYKTFIRDTFSSLPRRGIHDAHKRLQKALKKNPQETRYALQIDVKKFYPNIDHEILKGLFRKKFKDPELLWLIDSLIGSLGDRGIAIGSLFSQWAGNFYMTYFDHWIKEELRCKDYFRYCDDLIILSSSKEDLHKLRKSIEVYLRNNLNLELKNNHKVYPVEKQGIDFVGYRHFRKYTLLRKTTSMNMIRKMRDIQRKINSGGQLNYHDYCCISSYGGWLKWCNGYNLHNRWIKPLEEAKENYYTEVIKREGTRYTEGSKAS